MDLQVKIEIEVKVEDIGTRQIPIMFNHESHWKWIDELWALTSVN